MFGRRHDVRQRAEPSRPLTLAEMVGKVLSGESSQVSCETLTVSATIYGCEMCPTTNEGGMQLAVLQLEEALRIAAALGFAARLHVMATLEKPWVLPGGVRRITHPGTTDLEAHFSSRAEVERWLAAPQGRAMTGVNTMRWKVLVYRPRRVSAR